jgi:hypothetical protein
MLPAAAQAAAVVAVAAARKFKATCLFTLLKPLDPSCIVCDRISNSSGP